MGKEGKECNGERGNGMGKMGMKGERRDEKGKEGKECNGERGNGMGKEGANGERGNERRKREWNGNKGMEWVKRE